MSNPIDPRIEAAIEAAWNEPCLLGDPIACHPLEDAIPRDGQSQTDAMKDVVRQMVIAALKAADEAAWLPIESAPKDRTKVLLTDGKEVSQGWYDEWDRTFVRHDEAQAGDGFSVHYDEWKPTHWQPIPNPPQGK